MVDPIDLYVGRRLRGRRLTMKMSQEQLGKTVGVTFQQIQKYENGKNRISGSRIAKMAGALGVEPSYFFDGAPGIGKRNGGAEEAAWLAEPLTNKTLKAFVRIKSRTVRQAVLHLVRALDGK
jgi:transcriptional regulator with XRE-family HTH domain